MSAHAVDVALRVLVTASSCEPSDQCAAGLADVKLPVEVVAESVDSISAGVFPSSSSPPSGSASPTEQATKPNTVDHEESSNQSELDTRSDAGRACVSRTLADCLGSDVRGVNLCSVNFARAESPRFRWSPCTLDTNFSFATGLDGTICGHPSHDACRRRGR